MVQIRFGWSGRLVLVGLVLGACGGRSTRSDFTAGMSEGSGANDGAVGTGGSRVDGSGGTGAVGVGGSVVIGTGGAGAVSAGATGGSGGVTASDDAACVVDGIRKALGGNAGTAPAPPVACRYVNDFYCPGESYAIDEGPCQGSCTCQSDATWKCTYAHPQPGGGCKVTQCVDGEYTMDVGSSMLEDDECTVCHCTSQGWLCSSTACERNAFCDDLQDQYDDALQRATSCDPNSIVAQCTERFPLALGCEDVQVPLNVTEELAGIAAKFRSHGCYRAECPPLARFQGPVTCRPEGFCSDSP
jgi:hypothetical protein